MKLTEKQIETTILTYLAMSRGFMCYKQNNTGIYDPKTQKMRTVQNKFCPRGVSDIYGSYYSRAVYIEVKTPDAYAYLIKHYEELRSYVGPSKEKSHLHRQINFIESNRSLGCIAFFTCSLEMTKEKIKEFTEPREFQKPQMINMMTGVDILSGKQLLPGSIHRYPYKEHVTATEINNFKQAQLNYALNLGEVFLNSREDVLPDESKVDPDRNEVIS